MLYILTISRFILCFIFFYSSFTKLRDLATFERAIKNFQLLPNTLHRSASRCFIFLEIVIVAATGVGGTWLILGFSLTIGLLSLFIFALYSVLDRKIQTSCNCFGTSEQQVSIFDIWRNICILCVAFAGLLCLFLNNDLNNLRLLDSLFSSMVALIFSLLLLNLREILEVIV